MTLNKYLNAYDVNDLLMKSTLLTLSFRLYIVIMKKNNTKGVDKLVAGGGY